MRERIKNAMIIGGSRSAFYLATRLTNAGVGVTIVERSSERCSELASLLPKANVIEGDGSRRNVLDEEGIYTTDALVTLTDIDEENLIIALSAVQAGVPKVIAKVNRMEYIDTFRNMGVDTFINPKQLTCARVVRYVRAMGNTSGGSVQALHYIIGGKAEALEFIVNERTRNRGIPLSQMHIRDNILIASISRGSQIIIPSGVDAFNIGDTVVVVTLVENAIFDLNEIFT